MDPNKDENFEKEYDDAFDEASGDAPANDDDLEGVTSEADSGGESDEEADSGESDTGEAGEQDGEPAEEEEAAGEDDTGDEHEAGASSEGGQEPAGGNPKEPNASASEGTADYDKETLRQAAELLRQQSTKSGEQPAGEEPAEEPAESAQEEVDYSKLSWEDYLPEDQQESVKKYKEEWPEVYEAEKAIRDAQLQLIQDRIYSDLRGALAPVFETTQSLKVNAHLNAIREVHSDLDTIKPELNEWIAKQPEFVRPAYEQVAQRGSAEQVIQLIDQFKQAQGKTSAVPEVPASSARRSQQDQPPKKANKQPSAAAKRAMAAAPSPSTADVPGSANPNDFDAAWDEIEAGGLG